MNAPIPTFMMRDMTLKQRAEHGLQSIELVHSAQEQIAVVALAAKSYLTGQTDCADPIVLDLFLTIHRIADDASDATSVQVVLEMIKNDNEATGRQS